MPTTKTPALSLFGSDSIIKTTRAEVSHHEVFLDEPIGDPSEYRELISLLFTAPETDSFTMYINTPGGGLHSTMAIVEAMKHTVASVMGILMGETHSGGSMIAMWCNELAVLDSAEMMIHTASFGTVGFTGNVKSHTDFTVLQVENIIDKTYEGFLTPAEIKKVKSGVELWFNAKQIRERMEKRMELRRSQLEDKEVTEEE